MDMVSVQFAGLILMSAAGEKTLKYKLVKKKLRMNNED
jgi:hypothetical protein